MQPEELARAYDDWFRQWASPSSTELDNTLFSYHETALRIAGDSLRGARVIDIGCGAGRLTRELVLRGAAEVAAIDLSEVALTIARRRNAELADRVSFRQGDIECIPLPSCSVEVAFCCETLEHVLNPVRALRELGRVLSPGGLLVLTIPNYLSLLGLQRLSIRLRRGRYTEGGQPVNNLTMWPRTFVWLRRAGFDVRQVEIVDHYLPRRGKEPRKLNIPPKLGPLLRPFGQQAVFRAVH
jgi:SAM-dependent methyltransferase